MTKITKRDALKRFLKGENITLYTSKLNPMDKWHLGDVINIDSYNAQDTNYTSETDYFNKLVDTYKCYNCNETVGLRVNYYTTD